MVADPYGEYFWPDNVPRAETLAAFAAAYATIDFAPCQVREFDPGFEKIAIFARGGVPTHAARQLPNGNVAPPVPWPSREAVLRRDAELRAIREDAQRVQTASK